MNVNYFTTPYLLAIRLPVNKSLNGSKIIIIIIIIIIIMHTYVHTYIHTYIQCKQTKKKGKRIRQKYTKL